jgi:hypothetical protein
VTVALQLVLFCLHDWDIDFHMNGVLLDLFTSTSFAYVTSVCVRSVRAPDWTVTTMPQPKLVEVPDAANAAGYDGYMKGNARSNACAP